MSLSYGLLLLGWVLLTAGLAGLTGQPWVWALSAGVGLLAVGGLIFWSLVEDRREQMLSGREARRA